MDNQEKIQGHYKNKVELSTTPSGDYAYTIDMYRFPTVVTINGSTRNLRLLQTDDWLSKRENVHLLCFKGRPGVEPPSDTLPAELLLRSRAPLRARRPR